MNTTIRQTVKVQAGGVVHFSSPELREGTEAEVTVVVAAPAASDHRLAAFQALQKAVSLTPAAAAAWIQEADAERKAFGPQ